jgi:N-acetylmuramoyl-L-alanine amidase
LTGTSMPAILAEVSFVSSPEDESKLKSSEYRQQIAEALYKGIAHYATTFRRVDIASAARKPAGE